MNRNQGTKALRHEGTKGMLATKRRSHAEAVPARREKPRRAGGATKPRSEFNRHLAIGNAGRSLMVAALISMAAATSTLAQTGGGYDLSWSTIDSGGVTMATGGDYRLGGTIGQSDAGTLTGSGGYKLQGGFWPGAAAGVPIPCQTDVDCADQNVCTCDRCVNNECVNSPNEYGNSDCTGIPEIGDVICLLAGYSDVAACPNGDITDGNDPCHGNQPPFIDISDVLAVLDAYAGLDPCSCPP